MTIRERAKTIVDQVPNRDITSTGDPELFQRFTGLTQAILKANWDGGGIMTSCNGFTGWYSTSLGRGGLGRFDLSTVAASAFVKAGGSARPQYGDVVKLRRLHVCVSLDLSDNNWNVIEGGQGGPRMGYDVVKRNSKQYVASDIEGWVDIELWMNPAIQAKDALRAKLKGRWQSDIDWRKWLYDFSGTNSVSYIDSKNQAEKGTGTWDADSANVTITWSSGGKEVWPLPLPPAGKSGTGSWSDPSQGNGSSSFKKLW